MSIQNPIGYGLRLLEEVVDDPVGMVRGYFAYTGADDDKLAGIIEEIKETKYKLYAENALGPEAVENFDNRIVSILSKISVDTITKTGRAFALFFQTLEEKQVGGSSNWATHVRKDIDDLPLRVLASWPQEVDILSECTCEADVVSRLIPLIQERPIGPSPLIIEAQRRRLKYVMSVFASACLHMHVRYT